MKKLLSIVRRAYRTFARHDLEQRSKQYTRWDYKRYREAARALAHARVAHFNSFYGFRVGRISIRDTKTRWGSCSKRGNLNFNYKILFLPAYLADYVVVHELCHLQEFNHSQNFWSLVAKMVPEHKAFRAELKKQNPMKIVAS